MTIDVVSLFGMILVIGILVDDGIVIAENVSIMNAGYGWRPPSTHIGGITGGVCRDRHYGGSVFFVSLHRRELGDFFRDMATVIILTVVFSLVERTRFAGAHR